MITVKKSDCHCINCDSTAKTITITIDRLSFTMCERCQMELESLLEYEPEEL